MKKATKDWTSIAVRDDTHTRLTDLKTIKEPGKKENYDDVIRRGMDMPPIEEYEYSKVWKDKNCLKIIKQHHEDLKDDPNRLSSKFIADVVGCKCAIVENKIKKMETQE